MYVLKSAFMHLSSKYPTPISSTAYYRLNQQERTLYEEDRPDTGSFSGSHSYTQPDTSSSFFDSSSTDWGSSDSSSSDSGSSFDFGGGDSGGGGASGDW